MNKKLRKSESGQALVEFVLVFLVFITIFLAIIHLGFMSISKSLTNLAAYSACREYVVTYDSGKARRAAEYYLNPLVRQKFIPNNWSLAIDGNNNFGRQIITKIKTKYNPVVLPIVHGKQGFNMESHCTMTME